MIKQDSMIGQIIKHSNRLLKRNEKMLPAQDGCLFSFLSLIDARIILIEIINECIFTCANKGLNKAPFLTIFIRTTIIKITDDAKTTVIAPVVSTLRF